MAIAVATTTKIQLAAAWTGTAPGAPGTQTIAGTLSSASDISAYCTAVEVPFNVATQDGTTFGSGGFMVKYAGLKDGSLTLTLLNDFAATYLDSIIWTTLGGLGATVYFDVMPTSASRGTSNPSYVGAVIITDYKPIPVQVGGLAAVQVTWPTTGAFARLTS